MHVYVRSGATWSWQQTMVDGGGFGYTLALEGNTALIAREGAGPQVFERSGSTWSVGQTLTCSDGEGGDYGSQVALSGDTALVSAYSRLTGVVYVFIRSGGVWKQQQKLTGSDSTYDRIGVGDAFGRSISLSGDIAWEGGAKVRAVPFDAVELELNSLWADVRKC